MVRLAADFDSQLTEDEEYDNGHESSDPAIGSDDIKPEIEEQENQGSEQDSIKSRVDETQFEAHEIDTQASEITTFCVSRELDIIPPSSQSVSDGTSFFKRPVINDNDHAAGFSFGKFIKPTVNQFTARPMPGSAVRSTNAGSSENAAQTRQPERTRNPLIDSTEKQNFTAHRGSPSPQLHRTKVDGAAASVASGTSDVAQPHRTETASNPLNKSRQTQNLAPPQGNITLPFSGPHNIVPLSAAADESINSHADAAPLDTPIQPNRGSILPTGSGANARSMRAQAQDRLHTVNPNPLRLNLPHAALLDLAQREQPPHAAPHLQAREEPFDTAPQLRTPTAPAHPKQTDVSGTRSRSYGRIKHRAFASGNGQTRTPNSVLRRPFPEVEQGHTRPGLPAEFESPQNRPQPATTADLEPFKEVQRPGLGTSILEPPPERSESAVNDNLNVLPELCRELVMFERPSCPNNASSMQPAALNNSKAQSVPEQPAPLIQEGLSYPHEKSTSNLVRPKDAISIIEHIEVPITRQPCPTSPTPVDTHAHSFQGFSESPFRPSSAASGQSVVSRSNISAPVIRPANTTVHHASGMAHGQGEIGRVNLAHDILPPLPFASRKDSMQQRRAEPRSSAMTRPINIEIQQVGDAVTFQAQVLRTTHATRVVKPAQNRGTQTDSTKPQQTNSTEALSSQMAGGHITRLQQMQQMCVDYKVMLEKSKSQNAEIEVMREEASNSTNRIEELVAEKAVRDREIQKFRKVCEAYKEHMNRVVNAQKLLAMERETLKNEVAMATKESNEVKEFQKKVKQQIKEKISNLMGSIEEVKKMKECVIKDVEIENSLHAAREEAKILTKKADECAKQAQDSAKKVEEFGKKEEEAVNKLAEVSLENQNLWTQLKDAHKNAEVLQKDCDRFLNHLQSEQGNCQRLDKQLSEQMKIHKELVHAIKEIPKDAIAQFAKDEGFLSKLLAAEQTTHARFDDITKSINELKSHEAQPSSSLVKLIQDLSDRIPQPSVPDVNAEDTRQHFIAKRFDDLKTWLNQFCSDSQTHISLNSLIFELQQSNVTLATAKNASELEKQNLSKQVQEAQREINDVRSQLEAKSQEIKALQALPKEDPRLVAKIEDLEGTNSSLHGQLQMKSQDVSRLQEEFQILQESTKTSQDRINRFEKDKKEMRVAFAVEKQKDAELAEKNKTQNNVYYETTIMNQRQVAEDNAAEIKTMSEKFENAFAELEQMKSKSANPNLDQEEFLDIARIGRKLGTHRPIEGEMAEVHAAGKSISKCLTAIERIGEKVRSTVDAQIGVRNSVKRYEEENAALLKQVGDLQAKADIASEVQAKSHVLSSSSNDSDSPGRASREDDAILKGSFGSPRDLLRQNSIEKQTHATSQEVILETQDSIHSSIHDNAPAERVPAIPPLRPAYRVSQRISASPKTNNKVPKKPPVSSRTIPDSQEQINMQAHVSVVEKTATIKRVAPSHRHLLPSSPSVNHTLANDITQPSTPVIRPVATMDSSQSSVVSTMTDLDDFDFGRMKSTAVTKEHEKRRREKHGSSTRPVQTTMGSRTQNASFPYEHNAPDTNLFSDAQIPGLVNTPPKSVQNREDQPVGRKLPSHRLLSVLKSAMKSGAKLSPVEQFDTPKDSNARQTQSRPANTSVPGVPAGWASSKVSAGVPGHYNRVAASYVSGIAGLPTPAASRPAHKNRDGLTQMSLVPNAARRNSGFSGFNDNGKRPADLRTSSSKPSKAPRNFLVQDSPAESVKLKPRISLPPTRLQPGVRR